MNTISELIRANSPTAWLTGFIVGLTCFLCLSVGIRLFRRKLLKLSAGSPIHRIDVATRALSNTSPLTLTFISVYMATKNLILMPSLESLLFRGLIVVITIQTGVWGNYAILGWMEQRSQNIVAHGNKAALSSLNIFKVIAQFVLWTIILLLLLDNLGFNIRTLITSLGIGGVAVALSLQNILGDLFASLSIAADKPFEVGDFISVDDIMGTVRRIGLKTTRIQSIGGEELIFSNSDLLRSRVRNYKRMSERRVTFTFGVPNSVSTDQIKQVLEIVRRAIEAQEKAKFSRAHFKKFGASNLDFEVVYYMLDQDYSSYLDTQQAINLAMLTELSAAKISLAAST